MAEEENMPREEISEEVPQSEPAPETEQVPEGDGEAPGAEAAEGAEGAQTPAEEDAAEDASAEDEEASERSSNRKKVIIGVSIVVALIVIFIIILLLLLGSCTHRHSMTHVDGVGATCETPGVIDHWHCDECDKDYLDEDGKEPIGDVTIPPISHNIVIVEYQAATCTEPGHTAGAYCADCGEVLEEQEEIPALGHDFPEGGYEVTQEPTCTEEGVKECVCTRCGETKTEAIEALGHAPEETEPGVPAACEETGFTSKIVCTRCGEVLEEQEEIAPLGHDWGDPVVTEEPLCLFDGEEVYTCERCGTQRVEKIHALGHNMTAAPDIEPTCETSGVKGRRVCDRCGWIEEGEIIPPLGHEIENNECIHCHKKACTDLEFELSSTKDYYILVGLGSCKHTHILVPDKHIDPDHSELGELLVTTVRNNAFSSNHSNQQVEQIHTISFPYSVKSIGSAAFAGCTNLESVTFGTGLTLIESNAFTDCVNLTFVRFRGTTEGWQASADPQAVVGTPIDSSDLASPSKAAQLLTEDYYGCKWWIGDTRIRIRP